jgi:hypothetical protein
MKKKKKHSWQHILPKQTKRHHIDWRHKIRLWLKVNGRHHDGRWTFGVPNWGGIKTKKMMFKFMYHVGNPLLNSIIGYKKI